MRRLTREDENDISRYRAVNSLSLTPENDLTKRHQTLITREEYIIVKRSHPSYGMFLANRDARADIGGVLDHLILQVVGVVNEVATLAVGAETMRMIGAAQLRLVLGMTSH